MNLTDQIERTRKRDFTVRLPHLPPGTPVTYRLEQREFQVGSIIYRSHFCLPEEHPDRRRYLDVFKRHLDGMMVPVFWHLTEPEPGREEYDPYLAMAQWGRDHGKRMFGHALFYGWDGLDDCDPADLDRDFIQPWVRALDPSVLEGAMREYLRRSLERFLPYMSEFVLNNEVLGKYGTDPDDWFSRRLGLKSLAPYFQWAHEIAPRARFYVNENSILAGANTPKYAELIDSLLQAGAPVGGIGIQGHFFGDRVAPADEMWDKLEVLARFGLPIRVTEFGVKARDPELHAQDLLRLLQVCFAHPAVVGVNFWNFWEPDMWPAREPVREAHLWTTDWSIRPAGEALLDLLGRQWTTSGQGVLDARHEIAFRGFAGRYTIEAGGVRIEVTPDAANPA